jgi:N-formylglutamate amidohydrolase
MAYRNILNSAELPLIISAPHASSRILKDFLHRTPLGANEWERLNYVDNTTAEIKIPNAMFAIQGEVSRAMGDLNRARENAFERENTFTQLPLWYLGQELSDEEKEILLKKYRDPYYQAIERAIQKTNHQWLFMDVHNTGALALTDLYEQGSPITTLGKKEFYLRNIAEKGKNREVYMPPFILSNRGAVGTGEREGTEDSDYLSCSPDLLMEAKAILSRNPEIEKLILNYYAPMLSNPSILAGTKQQIEDFIADPVKINFAGIRAKKGTLTTHFGDPKYGGNALQLEYHRGMCVDERTHTANPRDVEILRKGIQEMIRKILPNIG